MEATMLTERERIVLRFLDPLMEASARAIGVHVVSCGLSGGYTAIGAAICGALRKKGLVAFVADLRCWRITEAGRAALR